MKKSDLKNGMLLVLRDGSKCLLIENEMFIVGGGSISLHFHNEDLCKENSIDEHRWDIVEVKKAITPSGTNIGIGLMDFLMDSDSRFKTIWTRPPKPTEEMTLEQVCKALGKDIKIVKG